VSANGFASQRTGFHEDFDEFRYTGGRDLYLEGLDVSGTAQGVIRGEDKSHKEAVVEVLRRIPRHDSPIKSLANLFAVSCGELATKFEALQRIPHPIFAPTSDYSYRPEKNTRAITSILEEHDNDEPFFLFTNYMDTHRCYKPSEELQKKHIGRSLGYNELVRLNEEVAAPWAYEEKKARDELEEEDVEDIRGLYAGEVETVDDHLRRLHETLESEGMLDDTLIVVTADHGENLGETDEMDRQRMGHEASVSDAVLNVPLLVAHPELDRGMVDEPISLKELYRLFINTKKDFGSGDVSDIIRDGPTPSQYPAKGGVQETVDNYTDAPRSVIEHATLESSAVGYGNMWKVVSESTGLRCGISEGQQQNYSEAPQHLTEMVQAHLTKLQQDDGDKDLSDREVEQLEALGYI
jgi:hypothetical protein